MWTGGGRSSRDGRRVRQANGQVLLPLVELITQARLAVDEVIDRIGRQAIETILTLSAEQIAGPRTPGKSSGEVRWHGSQNGRVSLAGRQIKVKCPRLRHKATGEVSVPAYESLQNNQATAQRMMGALLRGVSTREYAEVLPEMAETAGVSRSSVSRQAIEGSVEQLQQLRERAGTKRICWCSTSMGSGLDRIMSSVPWESIVPGPSTCKAFRPVRRRTQPRNVLDELPKEQQPQALNLMRAAWRVADAEEGIKWLEQLARFLEREYESAAKSLREGMREMFTVQRLQLPPSLYKCLGTTNVIESPQSGVQERTHNVTRWRTGDMVEHWVASAWLLTEKHFRKVIGHRDLWALAVVLGREPKPNASSEKVA